MSLLKRSTMNDRFGHLHSSTASGTRASTAGIRAFITSGRNTINGERQGHAAHGTVDKESLRRCCTAIDSAQVNVRGVHV